MNTSNSNVQQALDSIKQKDYMNAIPILEKLLAEEPDNKEYMANLAKSYFEQHNDQQSLQLFIKATQLYPDDPALQTQFGYVLYRLNRLPDAERHLRLAIKLDQQQSAALKYLGNTYRKESKWSQAIDCYEQAIAISADDYTLVSELYFALRSLCQWDNLQAIEQQLLKTSKDALANKKVSPIDPFVSVLLPLSAAQLQPIAQSHSQNLIGPIEKFKHSPKKIAKLRIAYVSGNVRNHATAYLAKLLFSRHNNDELDIYFYASNPNPHHLNETLAECKNFIDISTLSDQQTAQSIFDENINILIDLDGYTENNHRELFQYKPAPIQVNYLGYPGTLGDKNMDYIIADSMIIPIDQEKYYTAKAAHLPQCYQLCDYKQIPISTIPERKLCQLEEKSFVFACFNVSRKIEPEIFKCWMNILKNVPNSVLWLVSDNKQVIANLQNQAKHHGVAEDRLVFSQQLSVNQHLAQLHLADLYLDTLYCNAHTLVTDALWSGVPVLTILGKNFANRVAASIISAAGLEELVTHNLQEYQALAIDMANNPRKIAYLKNKLNQQKDSCALFDSEKYVANLEKLYQQMWDDYIKE